MADSQQPNPRTVKCESILVPMRDGTELSVHVYRPAAPGRFPAIVNYTPYRKGPLGDGSWHYVVQHGYAAVLFDIRGTGDSSGWNDSIYSDAERQDGYDMIEWAAAQSWCDGNVGIWGISFGAVVALQMARDAPPHLKAVIARSGTDDPYTEWTNPGGSPRLYMYQCYAPMMTARNAAPPDPKVWGDRWEEVWQQRLKNSLPWGIAFTRNHQDGPFWRDRSLRGNYDKVRCPVFVVGGWADWYATPLLRVFENLTVPKRALIGPWSHQWPDQGVPGPRIDWKRESLKWWDRWLKGIDTCVDDEPPVTLFIRDYDKPAAMRAVDRGTFRSERNWPIARTGLKTLYLAADGSLGSTAGAVDALGQSSATLDYDPRVGASSGIHGGGPFNVNGVRPLDQRPDEADALTFTTDRLADDAEVTGCPRVVLHFSSTAHTTMFVVKLCDVAPDGTSALVSKGQLNVTHRDSHVRPTHIEPGRRYQVEIQMLACAYRFSRGHRMRLAVTCADVLALWPTPQPCTNTIYFAGEGASAIILPVVPPDRDDTPTPALHRAVKECSLSGLPRPEYRVTRNIAGDTITLEYGNPELQNTATFTVAADDPAHAVLRSSGEYCCEFDGRKIQSRAECLTRTDADNFHHHVDLVITVDGKEYFRKQWEETVSRKYF